MGWGSDQVSDDVGVVQLPQQAQLVLQPRHMGRHPPRHCGLLTNQHLHVASTDSSVVTWNLSGMSWLTVQTCHMEGQPLCYC